MAPFIFDTETTLKYIELVYSPTPPVLCRGIFGPGFGFFVIESYLLCLLMPRQTRLLE